MHITLIACGDHPEILWNVFRMGNMMLEKMDEVTIFLNGPSVNYASLSSDTFPLLELAKLFTLSEGTLLA
ncbi:MAG: sulfur reduction protein DsrE [Thermodesulfobacteriota bacterium]